MFLYFRTKNSNPSKQELSARKFKKLKNDISSILPYVISTLVVSTTLLNRIKIHLPHICHNSQVHSKQKKYYNFYMYFYYQAQKCVII